MNRIQARTRSFRCLGLMCWHGNYLQPHLNRHATPLSIYERASFLFLKHVLQPSIILASAVSWIKTEPESYFSETSDFTAYVIHACIWSYTAYSWEMRHLEEVCLPCSYVLAELPGNSKFRCLAPFVLYVFPLGVITDSTGGYSRIWYFKLF